jgi:acetolactate synthase-1/2/3 large subunit
MTKKTNSLAEGLKVEEVRGADLLISTLANAGVTHIFALSGNQIMPIFDACIDAGIEIIHTRHEAAAVYMAEAYAQISGKPGVALVTAGAGLCNAVGAVFGASESQTPVLLISGDSPVKLDGCGAFQELDQVSVTSAVTRWSHRVTSFDSIAPSVTQALKVACGEHSGPAHLALPVDVLTSRGQPPELTVTQKEPGNGADPHAVKQIIDALAGSKKPLVILGPALSNTRCPDLAYNITKATNIPVVTMESPRGLNDPALGAVKSVIQQADVIVALGKRIDFSVQFGKQTQAKWLVVAGSEGLLQQASDNLRDKVLLCHHDHPATIAEALGNTTGLRADSSWLEHVKNQTARRAEPTSTGVSQITSAQLCSAVQQQINQSTNPILVCDGGEFGQWAQACLRASKRVINGLSGSIGAGVCYGIGAATALRDSTIFVMTGDGSLGFHLAEFETAVRNNAAFVVIVGNDKRWNAEHQIQQREFGSDRLYACALSDMQYHEAVVAMGGYGELVSHIDDLPAALARAVASNTVACVNVMIEGEAAPVLSC